MAYEQKEGRGSLFKNDRKEKDSHADYQGDINVDGKMYWLNAWLETSPKGTKYMSISVRPKDTDHQPAAGSGGQTDDPLPSGDLDDDIPF